MATFISNGEPITQASPQYDLPIVCNNGVLKARHQSGLPLGYQKVEYVTNTVSGAKAYISVGGLCEDDKTTGTCEYETTMSFANVNVRQIFGYGGSQRNHYFGVQSTHPEIGAAGTGINTQVTLSTDTKYTFKVKYGRNSSTNTELWVYDDNGNLLPNGYNKNGMYLGAETSKYFIFKSNYTGIAGATGCKFYGAKIWFDNTQVGNLIPCVRNSDSAIGVYNTVDGTFWAKVGNVIAGDPVSDPIEIYTDGTVETVEIDTTGDTATAEMLLKVGYYQDEQSIIDGVVTHRCGIKVLDGTENWVKQLNSARYGVILNDSSLSENLIPISSHFVGLSADTAWTGMYSGSCKKEKTTSTYYFQYDTITTIQDWKQFLADQYAAGTPVTVIYPLAEPTTESVAGQALTTQAGTNIVQITQASINNLALEVSYKGKQ